MKLREDVLWSTYTDEHRLWSTFTNHELKIRLGDILVARIGFDYVDTVSDMRMILRLLGIPASVRESVEIEELKICDVFTNERTGEIGLLFDDIEIVEPGSCIRTKFPLLRSWRHDRSQELSG